MSVDKFFLMNSKEMNDKNYKMRKIKMVQRSRLTARVGDDENVLKLWKIY